ncbi:MAG: 50S ribosomal protein L20 [Ignavibacteriaceae bacterium]|nr:MAG: 50S ribosomal protein L20 [Chlorobiota bacterium]KXK03810.1 MAG: 50S ribosomal protein L20 [Chlorobi bacterium OLB4]MBV6398177.1 50S ribosomal protein L20 [Ignavibacteria bacterium]MCC6885911.1 50S ribosomal protein L20 [Ignavibacteriales bacterium]MCE7953432.1 50S ribosomal protein L20 [Chlorobi bacterium CHB7]MDL1887368.1 50S ribosomal protein L20 [Ignavibacteria bacterium CHB1]MEB2330069.1 50S ribosomal protein L20 [Ignavibacteriaceae bacterium]OQY78693.1 MAG: 50S ribosomal protei
MPRSKNKVASHRRRKKVMEEAKGYWGARSKVYTVAKNAVEKGLTHAYRDRRLKKREFRSLWIQRINAAARIYDVSYSQLIGLLRKKNIDINRKTLAELAYSNLNAFGEIVKVAKS